MTLEKLKLYFHTIRHLKLIQVYYQLYNKIRKKSRLQIFSGNIEREVQQITPSIPSVFGFSDRRFKFLNLEKDFQENIDWNYPNYGKLWTYNLNYFEFLNQTDCSKEEGILLVQDFLQKINFAKDGLEPFPTSLRILNWMKFIVNNNINDNGILNSLQAQFRFLEKNLEYHLLGNHLLENFFSLVSASVFFDDKVRFKKYSTKLSRQLDEQILEDGAHFELSPMYHQLMLFRALDTYNFLRHSSFSERKIVLTLKKRIQKMLGWLEQMTFSNGDIPLLNDAAKNIAPTSPELFAYAKRLNIEFDPSELSDSGYRKWSMGKVEMIIDVGRIGPSYIPGHAHSDVLNFVMQVDNQAFIVDVGTSTYEKGEIRDFERSTCAHNTVVVNGQNQSQVWAGFRVAKRAKVVIHTDSESEIIASHNGYRDLNIMHRRTFVKVDDTIEMKDTIIGNNEKAEAYFHFHPNVNIEVYNDSVKTNLGSLNFEGATSITQTTFQYSEQFNKRVESKQLIVSFSKELLTIIDFEDTISNR